MGCLQVRGSCMATETVDHCHNVMFLTLVGSQPYCCCHLSSILGLVRYVELLARKLTLQ
jgi:hypothetical protein